MAANAAKADEKDVAKSGTQQPDAAKKEGEDDDKVEGQESEAQSTEDTWAKCVSDPAWWDIGGQCKKVGQIAEGAWDGMISSIWPEDKPKEQPKVTPAAATTTDAATPDAAKAEKRGFFGAIADGAGALWNGAKALADGVGNVVSDAWKGVFGQDAQMEITDADKNGKTDKVTVTQKDGDVITTDIDKTTIKKPDGTLVTRDRGVTTVEKDGISITRDRNGNETFKLKDGTTGRVSENGDMSVELKALREKITKDGVYGEIETANRFNKVTYFNTHLRYSQLSREQRDRDVVNAGDQSVMRVDKENGIHVVQGTTAEGDKRAFFTKEGSQDIVQIGVVDGQRVFRVGKLGADGKPDPSSFKSMREGAELPDWFKGFGRRKCHGRDPVNANELMDAAGVKVENGNVTVTHENMKIGPTANGGATVEVRRGDGPNDIVRLENVNGKQKVDDVANKQTTEWDGANHQYSQKNDGKEQISYNPEERHLKVYDEKGNLFADSTRGGTTYADGSHVGADGSYTSSNGTKYFSQEYQQVQTATNASVQAIAGADGHIGSFKAALGKPGVAVDMGELTGSMGNLTTALALCLKSGNFTHLAGILSRMGEVQSLMALGIQHNADVQTIKAAVPNATETQIASTKPAPNDVSVHQLQELNRRATA